MEASTKIGKMMQGNVIMVPTYQRAYSWDTPKSGTDRKTQTDIFLSDLEEHVASSNNSPYYLGHFIFEQGTDDHYYVIDGQQRLTTIVIFLSALFKSLKKTRGSAGLTEKEMELKENMVKRGSTPRFRTVDYDDQFFQDYVIDQTRIDHTNLDTESKKRIVAAFDYFSKQFEDESRNIDYNVKLLHAISQAACTTHVVKGKDEAIQMFLFQNDRGKRPTNLEVVKAEFMHNVLMNAGEEKDALINELEERFEAIYKSISSIETNIDENDILLYAIRVHSGNLKETDALSFIKKKLSDGKSGETPIDFIKSFCELLSYSFEYLVRFFGADQKNSFPMHSLIALGKAGGGIALAFPFIIKAYRFNVALVEKERLCVALERLFLRHKLIRTRAEIVDRINGEFLNFTDINKSVDAIVGRIDYLRTCSEESWEGYWRNDRLKPELQGYIDSRMAKYLLWKYEIYLQGQGKRGYALPSYDSSLELEHIAPQTEPGNQAHGYPEYDEEFRSKYLECLGNYVLISRSHNCAIGNRPFHEKLATYTHLEQQRDIVKMANDNGGVWTKDLIQKRKEKIVDVIMQIL